MHNNALIDYWSNVKTIVDKICEHYDSLWSKRHRILNSKIIMMIILKMITGDRRTGLSTNLAEFWDVCADKGYHNQNPYLPLLFARLVKNYLKIFLKI